MRVEILARVNAVTFQLGEIDVEAPDETTFAEVMGELFRQVAEEVEATRRS